MPSAHTRNENERRRGARPVQGIPNPGADPEEAGSAELHPKTNTEKLGSVSTETKSEAAWGIGEELRENTPWTLDLARARPLGSRPPKRPESASGGVFRDVQRDRGRLRANPQSGCGEASVHSLAGDQGKSRQADRLKGRGVKSGSPSLMLRMRSILFNPLSTRKPTPST
jgi:hypothetical protein